MPAPTEEPNGAPPGPPSAPGPAGEEPPPPVAAIVLAAGTSSRLGRPKQLLDLDGLPVLRHVVDAALASPVREVVVVLGYEATRISRTMPEDERLRVVLNPEFAAGASTSLRAGLALLDSGIGAAVVLLGDQPGVRPSAVGAVVEAWRAGAGPIVQAAYSGRPAHPTLLDRSVWPDLRRLRGDRGARELIRHRPGLRTLVELGGAPPPDIDTEEDYRRVLGGELGARQ